MAPGVVVAGAGPVAEPGAEVEAGDAYPDEEGVAKSSAPAMRERREAGPSVRGFLGKGAGVEGLKLV